MARTTNNSKDTSNGSPNEPNGSNGTDLGSNFRHHRRTQTIPFEHASRKKPRRWPLAFRFIKGAIHAKIFVPVTLHALFAALIVFLDRCLDEHLGLPPSIIPSLAIVVGLMLVFRNQTSFSRFWQGRNDLAEIITCVRNLTRTFITCSYHSNPKEPNTSRKAERQDTESAIKLLVAILFATKNHLRADWGAFSDMGSCGHPLVRREVAAPEAAELMPPGFVGNESQGLGVTLQLTVLLESYIKRGFERGWWHAPQASQLSVQLNNLVTAYGRMETIRLTPVPVSHLIHQKQVLALFGAVLPFAMVAEMGWWTIGVTVLVVFTLYGIDGIASELEDPFGRDRNDIPLDAVVEDVRSEILVLLDEWKRVGEGENGDGKGEAGGQWFTAEEPNGRRQLGVRFQD